MVIHPQARTTPKLRAEIKAQRDRKQVDLAKQYNVTPQTIRKWQNRDEFTDKSHRPHRLQTKLSEHQEMLVVELRKLLLLPLDDLLVIVREFIHRRLPAQASTVPYVAMGSPTSTRCYAQKMKKKHNLPSAKPSRTMRLALCMWT